MSRKVNIQSVDRAIDILMCFKENDEIGLTELSNRLDLHKSTVHGIVATLLNRRFLEKNIMTNKYRLGLEVFKIGTNVRMDIREIAYPCLETIVREFKETANLVVHDGESITFLEKIESTQSIKISTSIGGRQPIYCTSVGKVILANLPVEEQNELIQKMEMESYTENTITDKKQLTEELKRVKDSGIAFDNEEFQVGLICIAAPIFDHTSRPVAGISISGPVQRMGGDKLIEMQKTLRKCCENISRKLGYSSNPAKD